MQQTYTIMRQTDSDTTLSSKVMTSALAAKTGSGLGRWICRKGELAAIVGLMASSACYGLFALMHVA